MIQSCNKQIFLMYTLYYIIKNKYVLNHKLYFNYMYKLIFNY